MKGVGGGGGEVTKLCLNSSRIWGLGFSGNFEKGGMIPKQIVP